MINRAAKITPPTIRYTSLIHIVVALQYTFECFSFPVDDFIQIATSIRGLVWLLVFPDALQFYNCRESFNVQVIVGCTTAPLIGSQVICSPPTAPLYPGAHFTLQAQPFYIHDYYLRRQQSRSARQAKDYLAISLWGRQDTIWYRCQLTP